MGAEPRTANDGSDETAGGTGSDVAAIEASTAATVKTAQWLLGTAGALVPIVVAGVQLTRLGDAVESATELTVAVGSLVFATIAICVVLVLATSVLKVPYADLSEVLRIRSRYLKGGEWTNDAAHERWEHAAQIASAGSGGVLTTVPALHGEIQRLRASTDDNDRKKLIKTSEVARLVVAHVNRSEIERRFDRLKNWYIVGTIVVLTSVTVFVISTSLAPGEMSVDEPVAVRIHAATEGMWPEGLGDCAAQELEAMAVSGSWPMPDVAVPGSGTCKTTLIRRSDGVVAIPLGGQVEEASASALALDVDDPTDIVLYRQSESWSTPSLAACPRRKLDAVAIGGTWSEPVAVTRPVRRCPATLVEGTGEGIAVPVDLRSGGRDRTRG